MDNPEAFERKIAITEAQMLSHHVVLDIGCGTGSLVLRLAHAGAHVHGLDASSEMVRIARAKAEAAAVGNVTFHVLPFDDTLGRFEDESLDGVLAYSLLHLVQDRSAALAQMYRLLKPGGFFVASTVCLGDSWAPYGALLTVMRWLGKAPHVAVVSKQTLRDEIHAAGFVELREPDVGAAARTSFVVARKPCPSSTKSEKAGDSFFVG